MQVLRRAGEISAAHNPVPLRVGEVAVVVVAAEKSVREQEINEEKKNHSHPQKRQCRRDELTGPSWIGGRHMCNSPAVCLAPTRS